VLVVFEYQTGQFPQAARSNECEQREKRVFSSENTAQHDSAENDTCYCALNHNLPLF
jgi:hypothetical protein